MTLEVICGPMFSGKTEELIRRMRRAKIARKRLLVVKPDIDTRYSVDAVTSHSAQEFPAILIPCNHPQAILDHSRNVDIVGIDEVQFFSSGITRVIKELLNANIKVVVAGLDLDSFENPFGEMPNLLALAETVTKLTACCLSCGGEATRSFRRDDTSTIIEVGVKQYEARCRECYLKGG